MTGAQVLASLLKWWPCVDLDLFYGKVKFGSFCFCIREKGKTMDFSETVVVYDVKVGRCSKLNEYMNLYEYQRWRSFIDLHPRSLRFIFSNFFSLETCRPIEAKFHVEPPWDRGMKICSMVYVTWPMWPPFPYMVKTLKSLDLENWYAALGTRVLPN